MLKSRQEKLEEARLRREAAEQEKPQIEALGGKIATEKQLLPKYGQRKARPWAGSTACF